MSELTWPVAGRDVNRTRIARGSWLARLAVVERGDRRRDAPLEVLVRLCGEDLGNVEALVAVRQPVERRARLGIRVERGRQRRGHLHDTWRGVELDLDVD